jgi:starvation-inducible DNA-binding protein
MFDTSNDLSPATRQSAIEMLNEHLADAIDLQLQAKQAHWNIKGPNFVGLHELFDRVAAQADDLVEQLGGHEHDGREHCLRCLQELHATS